jgi:hypothetical protein
MSGELSHRDIQQTCIVVCSFNTIDRGKITR